MSPQKQKILVVEDDAAIARLIELHLKAAGYPVVCCGDGNEAMRMLQEKPWRLVVLDRMLPGISGMKLLRHIRQQKSLQQLPVLMVTALRQIRERVHGLSEGADDYLPKPFEPEELVARVGALLRRSETVSTGLTIADIHLDPDVPEVRVGGHVVELRRLEFKLLHELMKRAGKVCKREYLLNHVWGADAFVEPRTVDVAVKRLRKSLSVAGSADYIKTIRGIGYRFTETQEQ